MTNNKATNTEGKDKDQTEIKSVFARLDSLEKKIDELENKDDVAIESIQHTTNIRLHYKT